MNVNPYNTTDYENKYNWTLGQNKPNSNPIKPNFRKAKMNVSLYVIEDYRKKDDFAVRKNKPNSNPISSKAEMNLKSLAGKSGHTRKNLGLIFLTITLECLTEKHKFLTQYLEIR